VILAVVGGLSAGKEVTVGGVAATTAIAVGFLVATLVVGAAGSGLVRWSGRIDLPGTATTLAIMLAFALAWLSSAVGSAVIIGAMAAGLLLRNTPRVHEIEAGVKHLGHFFVPIFFIFVGAAVDVRVFNPFDAASWPTLLAGALLIVAAVLGKFLAGYAPFWFRGRKMVIGVGMIPRAKWG